MSGTTDRDYLLRGISSIVHEVAQKRDPSFRNSKGCPSGSKVDDMINRTNCMVELDYRAKITKPIADKIISNFDLSRKVGMSIIIHLQEATKGLKRPLFKSVNRQEIQLSIEEYMRTQSVAPEVRKKICVSIASRQKRMEAAHTYSRQLVQLYKSHRDNRKGTYLSVSFLGEDAAGRIVELLQWKSRASLMKSCTEFHSMQYLNRLLPHLHIRKCPGHFPHHIGYSDTSMDTWYISKQSNVTLFLDIAIEGATESSVMPPSDQYGEMIRTNKDIRQVCKRSAPEEECVEGMFRRLISHKAFFSTPVECTAKLLYESGEEVMDEHGELALKLSPESRNKGSKCTETLTMRDNSIHPARITFKINALSTPKNQYFKIRVKGTARLKPKTEGEEGQFHQIFAESRVFMIKSHKKTAESSSSKAAEKRRKLNDSRRSSKL